MNGRKVAHKYVNCRTIERQIVNFEKPAHKQAVRYKFCYWQYCPCLKYIKEDIKRKVPSYQILISQKAFCKLYFSYSLNFPIFECLVSIRPAFNIVYYITSDVTISSTAEAGLSCDIL